MSHWIFIEEGAYPLDAAYLVTAGRTGVCVEDAILEVYLNGNGERRVRGSGMTINALIVELLEDHDELDMLVDLGEQFKYRMHIPSVTAGKLFEPGVKSLMHFAATGALEKLDPEEYRRITSGLTLLSCSPS